MNLALLRVASPTLPIRWFVAAIVALVGPSARSQEVLVRLPGEVPESPRVEAKELAVSPADEPLPALRYRFLPSVTELVPGNAAPIYMRPRFEFVAGYPELQRDVADWIDLPFAKFPTEEARRLVDNQSSRLQLLEFGARRSTCDWNYTLPEQRLDATAILLPDAQEMRTWARLLNVKARVEIREGKYDDAARTLETCFAFARHCGMAPFLVNKLIGISVEAMTLDRVEELIGRPDAPNLYWALTSLPRPLIDLREAMEVERSLGELMVPELGQVDKPHTPAGWTALLEGMHSRMQALAARSIAEGSKSPGLAVLRDQTLDEVRKAYRLKARIYAARRLKLGEEQVRSLPEDQTIAVYIAGHYRDFRDQVFKASYVPFRDSQAIDQAAEDLISEAKEGPLALYADLFPRVPSMQRASVRVERRVAALRVVEALRLHASRHDGRLPSSLEEIAAVPVPTDPATDAPFAYERAEAGATLSAPPIDDPQASGIQYRITIRR